MSTAHDQKARFVTSEKNEIWEFKSDKSFNFMSNVFLQSITVSGYIPTKILIGH